MFLDKNGMNFKIVTAVCFFTNPGPFTLLPVCPDNYNYVGY